MAGGIAGGAVSALPVALVAGPAALGAVLVNRSFFRKGTDASKTQLKQIAISRKGSIIGSIVGSAGSLLFLFSNGSSSAAIVKKLKVAGSLLHAGPLAGLAVLAIFPVISAGVIGGGTYLWWQHGLINQRKNIVVRPRMI